MSAKLRIHLITTLLAIISLYGCNKHNDQQAGGLPVERNAKWYEAHSDALKIDEKKCAGEAPTMTRDECQNVYSAETDLGAKEMEDAAAHNNPAPAPPDHK